MRRASVAPRTIDSYEWVARKYLRPRLGWSAPSASRAESPRGESRESNEPRAEGQEDKRASSKNGSQSDLIQLLAEALRRHGGSVPYR